MSTKQRGKKGAGEPGGGEATDHDSDSRSLKTLWHRAITRNSEWPDKDDLLDVLYWLRQIYSGVLGVLWGVIPFHGLLAIVLYVALSTVIGHVYVTTYQGQDEEELGGMWELAKEGFGSAIATFIVTWIIVYSSLYS